MIPAHDESMDESKFELSRKSVPDEDSPARRAFKDAVGDIYVDPEYLDPVREVSDRALTCIVEEARWYNSEEDEDKFIRVIVKTFRPNIIANTVELDELLEECKRIKALEHPSIIQLEGVGCFKALTKEDVRTSVFLVEEFGGLWSLFKMLRSKKLHPSHPHVQFTPTDCMRWVVNIAEGLEYLHKHKIVHRDLKPENIWLTDADVSECVARIGDLKPHRRNFRKIAHGHTPSRVPLIDMPLMNSVVADGTMRQFSLARHQTMTHHRHLNRALNRSGSHGNAFNQLVMTSAPPEETHSLDTATGLDASPSNAEFSQPTFERMSSDVSPSGAAAVVLQRKLQALPSFMQSVHAAEPEGLAMKLSVDTSTASSSTCVDAGVPTRAVAIPPSLPTLREGGSLADNLEDDEGLNKELLEIWGSDGPVVPSNKHEAVGLPTQRTIELRDDSFRHHVYKGEGKFLKKSTDSAAGAAAQGVVAATGQKLLRPLSLQTSAAGATTQGVVAATGQKLLRPLSLQTSAEAGVQGVGGDQGCVGREAVSPPGDGVDESSCNAAAGMMQSLHQADTDGSAAAGKKRASGWNTVKVAHRLASSLKGTGTGDATSPRAESPSTMQQLLKPSSSYKARVSGLTAFPLSPSTSSSALNLEPNFARTSLTNSPSKMNRVSFIEGEEGPRLSQRSSALGSNAQALSGEQSLEGATGEEDGQQISDEATTAPEEITLGIYNREHEHPVHHHPTPAHVSLVSEELEEEVNPSSPRLDPRVKLTPVTEVLNEAAAIARQVSMDFTKGSSDLNPRISSQVSLHRREFGGSFKKSESKKVIKKVVFKTGVPEGLAPTEDYSLLYAAPEYINSMNCDTMKTLTAKSDVFSFAVVMYEVLNQGLINPAQVQGVSGGWHTTSHTLHGYALKVAGGYREKIPDRWPDGIKALIQQCWDQDPSVRPSMSFVVKRLKEIANDPYALRELIPPPPLPESPTPDPEDIIIRIPRTRSYSTDDPHEDEEDDEEDDEDGEGREGAEVGEGDRQPSETRQGSGMLGGMIAGLKRVSLTKKSPSVGSPHSRTSLNLARNSGSTMHKEAAAQQSALTRKSLGSNSSSGAAPVGVSSVGEQKKGCCVVS